MFVYMWEYVVSEDHAREFRKRYGPDGDWVALFRRADGYLDTTLLNDRARPDRYVTIDRWESEDAHASFRREYQSEFEVLDAECELLTSDEGLIGHFTLAGGAF